MRLKLEGKTTRGNEYVKKYGEWWDVVSRVKNIIEWGLVKPMLYIKPSRVISGKNGFGSHWIHLKNDPDYVIMEKIE